MKDPNNYPPGWDPERVHRLIQHYESQTDEEAISEDEAAFEDQTQTIMEIPNELLPSVRSLLEAQTDRSILVGGENVLLELTGKQRQVSEVLKHKTIDDHSLGDWYLGALHALRNKHNPERFSQAAQSLRELLEKLPRTIDESDAVKGEDFKGRRRGIIARWEKDKKNYSDGWKDQIITNHFDKTLRKIDSYLEKNQHPTRSEQIHGALKKRDPMNYVLGQDIQEEKRKRFADTWEQFEAFAHHRPITNEQDFEKCLSAAEDLILDLLAPYTAPNQQTIKSVLDSPAPTNAEMNHALDLVKRNGANHTFFFKYAQHPIWISVLKERGFFDTPQAGELDSDDQTRFRQWQPLLFLQRVANIAPEQVVEVLVNLPETDNPLTSHRICVIASAMEDTDSSLRLRPWVNKYIKSSDGLLDYRPITDLLRRWGSGSDDSKEAALNLLKSVVQFHHDPESEMKKESRKENEDPLDYFWNTRLKPAPRFEEWHYLQLMEKGVRPLAGEEPFKVANILIDETTRMIRLSSHQDNREDVSWVRLDQVDEAIPDFNSIMIHTLTYACENVYENAPGSIANLEAALKSQPWKLFKRLRQHLYAENPSEQTLPWIRDFILGHTDYAGVGYDFEFLMMLVNACEHFGAHLLSEEERIKTFDEIIGGPPEELYLVVTGFSGAQYTEEGAARWKRFHQRKKLRPFADLLFGRYKTYYQQLEDEFRDIPLSKEDYLPFRTSSGGFVSDVSPQSFEMLAMKDDEELLTFINEWDDEHEDSGDWLKRITIRGLADEFQKLFRNSILPQEGRLKFWFENRDQIERPVYVKAIVQTLQESAKERNFEETAKWFEFCEWVLSHPDRQSEDGGIYHENSRELPDWSTARWAVMDFVDACLDNDVNFPFSGRDSLFRLFSLLCNQPDWRLDHARPVLRNGDSYVNEAINNVRSRALLKLVDFGIWVQRHDSDDRLYELTSILETRFEDEAEFPLTFPERALLGWQYGNFFAMNKTWAIEHKTDFFPQEDLSVWTVAFGHFLSNCHACIPYYEALKEDYEFALGDLEGMKLLGSEFVDNLGQHLFDYYAWDVYPLKGEESLLERFYLKTTNDPERWANLFHHVGSALSRSNAPLEGILRDRVVNFFDWRFQSGEPEELRLFGFWLEAECLEPAWRLDALKKLLNLDQWREQEFFLFLDSLESLLEGHVAKVVECFARMTETLHHGDLYPEKTVKAIIAAGLNSEDESVYKNAEYARETLLREGEFDYLDFVE